MMAAFSLQPAEGSDWHLQLDLWPIADQYINHLQITSAKLALFTLKTIQLIHLELKRLSESESAIDITIKYKYYKILL